MAWNLLKPRTATAEIPLTDAWRTDVDSSVVAYRSGDVVTVAAWRLSHPGGGGSGEVDAYMLPPGFRPVGLTQSYTRDSRGKAVALSYAGRVSITDPSGPVAHHSFTFLTADPMPKGGG